MKARLHLYSIRASTKFQTLTSAAQIIADDGVGVNGLSVVARSKRIYIEKETMIAPNCLAAGVPARVVRHLADE